MPTDYTDGSPGDFLVDWLAERDLIGDRPGQIDGLDLLTTDAETWADFVAEQLHHASNLLTGAPPHR
jgi:hypothetical protein